MVAEGFMKAGYQVSLGEPMKRIDRSDFDVLAFTLSRADLIEDARRFLNRQRDLAGKDLRVIVGGAAFRTHPELVDRLGADGWAQDPHSALALVQRLMHPELISIPDAFLATAPSGHA